VASSCYNAALNNASELLKENKVSKNIFNNQLTIFRAMAQENKLPIVEQLPEVSFHFIESFSRSRVNFKNQWASHPSLEDRKLKLEELGIDIAAEPTSAWTLFNNPGSLQEKMTEHLYKAVNLEVAPESFDGDYFEKWYSKERETVALPAEYNGFYNNRFIEIKDWDLERLSAMSSSKSFPEIFSEENGKLQSSISMNENDLDTLKQIQQKQIDVTSFDFDGTKYTVKEVDGIITTLEEEITNQKAAQLALDKESFTFFVEKSGSSSMAIKEKYQAYKTICAVEENYVRLATDIMNTVNPFFQGNVTLEQVVAGVGAIKENYEVELKRQFNFLVDEKMITAETRGDLLSKIVAFNGKHYTYFVNNQFLNNELNDLCDIVIKVAEEVSAKKFNCYKSLLEKQLEVIA
jgi:hypothetical protein